jgi:hypothetical protein
MYADVVYRGSSLTANYTLSQMRRSNSQTSGAKPGRQYSWQASCATVKWKGSSHLLSGNLLGELDDPTAILYQLARPRYSAARWQRTRRGARLFRSISNSMPSKENVMVLSVSNVFIQIVSGKRPRRRLPHQIRAQRRARDDVANVSSGGRHRQSINFRSNCRSKSQITKSSVH